MTDAEIISGIKANSPQVWRELYFQMKSTIGRSIALLMNGVKDVTFDDVYEDALLILMENVKDGKLDNDGETNVAGYLYTICRRIALKHCRRKPLEPDVSGEVKMASPGGGFTIVKPGVEDEDNVDPDVLSEEDRYARNFLDRVLNSIPESCRKLLKRFYWDKMTMEQIAPLMGLKNANSAKTTKNRCMDKFKDIAKKMLADDEKAERAVQRAVERDALRDLLEQFRKEDAGDLAVAAWKEEKNPEK